MAIAYLNCVSCEVELKESVNEYLGCFYCDACYEKKMEKNRVRCVICDIPLVGNNDACYLGGVFYCTVCYERKGRRSREKVRKAYANSTLLSCTSCGETGIDLTQGTSLVAGNTGLYCKRCFSFATREGMRKERQKTKLYSIACTTCGRPLGKSDAPSSNLFYCARCYNNREKVLEKDVSPWELRVKQIEVE